MQVLRRYRTVRAITVLVSGSSIAQILMAINALVLARYLAPETYGYYVAAYSAAGLSSFAFNWGLDTWLLRQGVTAQRDPQGLVGRVLAIKIGLGLIWITILPSLLPSLSPGVFAKTLVFVSALDVWCEGLFSAELALLNTVKRVAVASALLLLSRGGRLFSTVLLGALGASSPIDFAQARLGATLLGLAIAILAQSPRFNETPTSLLQVFYASTPFVLSDLLATVYLQVDVTILAVILRDERAVGLYAPASGIVNALFVIPAAGFTVLVPILTHLQEGNKCGFVSMAKKMFRGYLAVGIVLWFGIWGIGRLLVELLLGKGYIVTGDLLTLISPILFLKSVSFASAAVLVAVGWQRYRLLVQTISAFVNVLFNLIVVSQYGIWGVAYVYVISETILTLGYTWFAVRGLKAQLT